MESSVDSQAKQARRLHLHIPNSHPRATSPRSSPRSSPILSPVSPLPGADLVDTEIQDGRISHAVVTNVPSGPIASQHGHPFSSKLFAYFRADITSGESSRDFLARERTYFSWLRLSALLAIASVALFLPLRLPSIDEGTVNSIPTIHEVNVPPQDLAGVVTAALARKAMRKQFISQNSQGANGNSILHSHPTISDNNPYMALNSTSGDSSLIRSPAFSKVLGSLFFILAIIALLCGHIDYMRCQRALEEADKLVTIGDQMTGTQSQGERMLLHSASSAKKAHSSHFVHAVEIVIALSVFSTALIILITVTQGNIQPPSPGRWFSKSLQ